MLAKISGGKGVVHNAGDVVPLSNLMVGRLVFDGVTVVVDGRLNTVVVGATARRRNEKYIKREVTLTNVSNVFHGLKNVKIAQRSLKICQFWPILTNFSYIL
jgi:hypothetical protein